MWAPIDHIETHCLGEGWQFAVSVSEEAGLWIHVSASSDTPLFEMRGPGHFTQAAGFRYDGGDIIDRCACDEQEAFTDKWLPFFRRGCWLSGCPIEATAHEKAEWMRGFSREELEAWNLKM